MTAGKWQQYLLTHNGCGCRCCRAALAMYKQGSLDAIRQQACAAPRAHFSGIVTALTHCSSAYGRLSTM